MNFDVDTLKAKAFELIKIGIDADKLKNELSNLQFMHFELMDRCNKIQVERDALKAELEAARKQEPIYQHQCGPDYEWEDINETYVKTFEQQGRTVRALYASPVPAQQEWEAEAKRAFWAGLEIGAAFGVCQILPRWNEYLAKRKGEL